MAGDRKNFLAVGKFPYLKSSPNTGAHSNVFDAHTVLYLGAIFPVQLTIITYQLLYIDLEVER